MPDQRSTWTRDLSPHLDRFGHISVHVTLGGGPGTTEEPRVTGASAPPQLAARFLRDLADDVDALTRKDTPCAR